MPPHGKVGCLIGHPPSPRRGGAAEPSIGETVLKPKAYSYIRMSLERQSYGDSERGQLELSESYAAEHGLDLDTSHRDIGVSAYKGAKPFCPTKAWTAPTRRSATAERLIRRC